MTKPALVLAVLLSLSRLCAAEKTTVLRAHQSRSAHIDRHARRPVLRNPVHARRRAAGDRLRLQHVRSERVPGGAMRGIRALGSPIDELVHGLVRCVREGGIANDDGSLGVRLLRVAREHCAISLSLLNCNRRLRANVVSHAMVAHLRKGSMRASAAIARIQ